MPTFDTVGAHVLADFWGCQFEKLDDPELLMESLRQAARSANMTILAEEAHKFFSPRLYRPAPALRKPYFHPYLSGEGICRS